MVPIFKRKGEQVPPTQQATVATEREKIFHREKIADGLRYNWDLVIKKKKIKYSVPNKLPIMPESRGLRSSDWDNSLGLSVACSEVRDSGLKSSRIFSYFPLVCPDICLWWVSCRHFLTSVHWF